MIPINKPWIDEEERQEVLNVLDGNPLTSPAKDGGKKVQEFENLLKEYLNAKYVIAVNSGTSALHAALLAAGIKQGDEVLLPSFTFVATANSVIAAGARPVFVDINREDYTISTSDLQSKITPRSRIVIPVHLYGHPSNMDEILEIAQRSSLDVIEDACQSLGSSLNGKQTGTFGTMGCFSMYASKVVTSGEGGAIATNSQQVADKLKMIRNHGMVEGYDTTIFGLNLRLPELSAAVAKIQMKKLSRMLDMRRRNAYLLSKHLSSIDGDIIKFPEEKDEKQFNWYLYTVAFKNKGIRDRVKQILNSKFMVGATVYYHPPVHRTPYYSNLCPQANLPETDLASDCVLSLPVHPFVTDQDIEYIATSLKNSL